MTQVAEPTLEDVPQPAPAAPPSLFTYSTWVHAGHGAEDCSEVDEEAGVGRCSDSAHFHAWCRLPNDFQQQKIRDHGLAAKARKIRQMRQDGTDVNEILESSLDELVVADDRETLVSEMLSYEWSRDFTVAVRETRDLDDDSEGAEDGEKLYAHIEADQERYRRLSVEDPDSRNRDEFEELEGHVAAYVKTVQERYEAITAPKRTSYEEMDVLDLVGLVRGKRIAAVGGEEFTLHYTLHEILACTYKAVDGDTYFRDLKQVEGCAPEVMTALQSTFVDLERTSQSAEGN